MPPICTELSTVSNESYSICASSKTRRSAMKTLFATGTVVNDLDNILVTFVICILDTAKCVVHFGLLVAYLLIASLPK